MDGHAGDVQPGGGGVEVLVLDGAGCPAVHGVGVLSSKGGHVKVVRALADLLIRSEGHADAPVGNTLGQQLLTQGHDFSHARLIVRPQQGGAVGGDEGLSLEGGQEGEIGYPDDPALPGQHNVPAVVVLVENGVHVLAGKGGRGVHVGQEAQSRSVFTARRSGQPGGDDTVFVHAGVFQPQLLQLVHQQPGQVPLAGGGGGDALVLRRGSMDLDILQQSLIRAHECLTSFL